MKFSCFQMWKLPQFVWVCLRMCLCVSFCSNCLYFSSNLWVERGNGLFLDCLCCEWSDKAAGITAVRQGFRIKYWVWPNLENTLKGKKCLHLICLIIILAVLWLDSSLWGWVEWWGGRAHSATCRPDQAGWFVSWYRSNVWFQIDSTFSNSKTVNMF